MLQNFTNGTFFGFLIRKLDERKTRRMLISKSQMRFNNARRLYFIYLLTFVVASCHQIWCRKHYANVCSKLFQRIMCISFSFFLFSFFQSLDMIIKVSKQCANCQAHPSIDALIEISKMQLACHTTTQKYTNFTCLFNENTRPNVHRSLAYFNLSVWKTNVKQIQTNRNK